MCSLDSAGVFWQRDRASSLLTLLWRGQVQPPLRPTPWHPPPPTPRPWQELSCLTLQPTMTGSILCIALTLRQTRLLFPAAGRRLGAQLPLRDPNSTAAWLSSDLRALSPQVLYQTLPCSPTTVAMAVTPDPPCSAHTSRPQPFPDPVCIWNSLC